MNVQVSENGLRNIAPYETNRQEFQKQLNQVKEFDRQSQSAMKKAFQVLHDSQETMTHSLGQLCENIAGENQLSNCQVLLSTHEKTLESQLLNDLDVSKLGVQTLPSREKLIVRLQTTDPTESATTVASSSVDSQTESRSIKAAQAIARAMFEVYRLQSRFATQYDPQPCWSIHAERRAMLQRISICMMKMISLCNQYQQNFLDQLDVQLAMTRNRFRIKATEATPVVESGGSQNFRLEISQTQVTITELFVDQVKRFEATSDPLEVGLEDIKARQKAFCEKAANAMLQRVQGDQGKCFEITKLYVDIIKGAGDARLNCYEAMLKVYVALEKEHMRCLVRLFVNFGAILAQQQEVYAKALFVELKMNSQKHGGADLLNISYEDFMGTWLSATQKDFNASFGKLIGDNQLEIQRWIQDPDALEMYIGKLNRWKEI